MQLGLSTLNFDEDRFEAVLDTFAAAKEPVTKIAVALMLAPPPEGGRGGLFGRHPLCGEAAEGRIPYGCVSGGWVGKEELPP